MKREKHAALLMSALTFLPAVSQADIIPFDSEQWVFRGEAQEFIEYKGKSAVKMTNSTADLADISFTTGTIEFDILTLGDRGFSGVKWHIQSEQNSYENFYIRPHQAGKEDANQYNPVFNGVAAWQIMFSPYYSAALEYKVDEWMHVRVDVFEDSADIYIDSDTPSLRVRDLKGDFGSGAVGISSGFAPAYFANFSVSTKAPVKSNEPSPEIFELPEGLISSFEVSQPISENDIEQYAENEALQGLSWKTAKVETNGVLNIAKHQAFAPETNTVFVRLKMSDYSDNGGRLIFGYSDRVRVMQNNNWVYQGTNGYMTRDYRYLGTIGLFDSIFVPENGVDEYIYFAVSESFGGWGFMAALP